MGPPPPFFELYDKIAHVCTFALLAALMRRGGLRIWQIAALLGGLAVAIELAQAFLVTGRTASYKDVLAGLFGIAVGVALPRRVNVAQAGLTIVVLAFAAQGFHNVAKPIWHAVKHGILA